MKRMIKFLSAITIFSLSFAAIQPGIVYGFSFDYVMGGHSVSIVYGTNNHATWWEATADSPPFPTSFSLTGRGNIYDHQPLSGAVNLAALDNASAVSANASLGTIGVKAEAVDPTGIQSAAVQTANAYARMGGQFYITGSTNTVDLVVRTTLNGAINVAQQRGIIDSSIMQLEMGAGGPGWSSSAGWTIVSKAETYDENDEPLTQALYLDSDQSYRLSGDGYYEFNNYEIALTIPGVKTNELFGLDLNLNADIRGPGLEPGGSGGTLGDYVRFFDTYSMGFASDSPGQWFELPDGYSITQSSPSTVPEPATMLLLGLGFMGLAGIRRKMEK